MKRIIVSAIAGLALLAIGAAGLHTATENWLPAYPGAVKSSERMGIHAFETSDPPQQVLTFYRQKAADMAMTVTYDQPVGVAWHLSARDDQRHRRFALRVRAGTSDADGSSVAFTLN